MAHGVMEEWREQASPADNKCAAGEGRVLGTRRIFAPQFKLQVLDSYRQDADCKGNQRATARKYGIHRRQIQKWLQMETHLRSITAGSGTQQPPPPQLPLSVSLGDTDLEPASALALNLSCEAARLPGATAREETDERPPGSFGSPHAATYVLRPSVSPTLPADRELPIKKRYFEGLIPDVPLHPGSPLSEEDQDDDEEDVDVDGTESEASSQAALDYTSATLSKRRSFSLQYKLEVLDAFRGDPLCQGNQRATARAFGINRRQVQKWLGQEPELRDEAVCRGGLNRQRLGRWLDQDQLYVESGGFCLDLSRKRKSDPQDSEAEAKKMKISTHDISSTANNKSMHIKLESGAPFIKEESRSPMHIKLESGVPFIKEETRSPKSDTSEVSSTAEDWLRQNPHLPPHPLLFRPQPLPFLPLPGADNIYLPFSVSEKKYSLDLKLSPFDLYSAHQQNWQKWLKQDDLFKHSNSSFLLNSFR